MDISAAHYRGNSRFTIDRVPAAAPGPDQVQIDVAYCGICGTDLHVFLGHMDQRVGFERVIGHEMSGTVAAVGPGVTRLTVGEPVVVRPLDACGDCPACASGHAHICQNLEFLGLDSNGAFQEKWTVPAHTVHKLPPALSLKHAALIEPVAVACHDVRRGRVVAGEDVLVIGGGPIGMLIAMVAGHRGAHVTVSEINPHRIRVAESLGFTALDPRERDIDETIRAATGGKGADVIFEVSGTQPGVDLMTQAAATRCRVVMVAIHAKRAEVDLFQFFWKEIEMLGARVYEPDDYDEAIELVASGAIDAARLITDTRDLDDIGDAFEALTGNPRAMKTLIRCRQEVPPCP